MKIISDPLVSIIVNCRNSEVFLEECLQSILRQTYKNFEVILWDNNSTDSTAELAKKFQAKDHRINYFRGETFVSLGYARNLALKKCKGDFIAFLDSDDIWDLNFLYDQIYTLHGNENRYFGYGHVEEFTAKIPVVYKKKSNLGKNQGSTFENLLDGNFIYFSSIVVSRLGINFVNEFNENLIQAEDYDFILRLARKFHGIQTGYVFYRLHDNNFSKSQKLENYTENLTILKSYLSLTRAKKNYAKVLARFFVYAIQKGKKKEFLIFVSEHKKWIPYLIFGFILALQKKCSVYWKN